MPESETQYFGTPDMKIQLIAVDPDAGKVEAGRKQKMRWLDVITQAQWT